eukprot:1781417-Rhodomonas_salina.1
MLWAAHCRLIWAVQNKNSGIDEIREAASDLRKHGPGPGVMEAHTQAQTTTGRFQDVSDGAAAATAGGVTG